MKIIRWVVKDKRKLVRVHRKTSVLYEEDNTHAFRVRRSSVEKEELRNLTKISCFQ